MTFTFRGPRGREVFSQRKQEVKILRQDRAYNTREMKSIIALSLSQLVKNLAAMQETPVQFLGWEDLLEKGRATHSSIFGLPWWLSW